MYLMIHFKMGLMKVLFFVFGSKQKYGSEKVAVDVIERLSKMGNEFIVITAMDGYVRDYCKNNNIETYRIKFYSYLYRRSRFVLLEMIKRILQVIYGVFLDCYAVIKLKQKVDLSNIDLIYTNHYNNLIGGYISRKYKIPHIVHLHELFHGHFSTYPLLPNQIKWVDKHTDSFISCAKNVKENWVKAGLDPQKIKNIYNGIEVDTIPSKQCYPCAGEKIKMVMVASISSAKGQHII